MDLCVSLRALEVVTRRLQLYEKRQMPCARVSVRVTQVIAMIWIVTTWEMTKSFQITHSQSDFKMAAFHVGIYFYCQNSNFDNMSLHRTISVKQKMDMKMLLT